MEATSAEMEAVGPPTVEARLQMGATFPFREDDTEGLAGRSSGCGWRGSEQRLWVAPVGAAQSAVPVG